MDIPLAKNFDGKKFLWDGAQYETKDHARQKFEAYQKEGFEVRICKNTDTYLVYSRRVAVKQAQD
jgi:hypothetical protein